MHASQERTHTSTWRRRITRRLPGRRAFVGAVTGSALFAALLLCMLAFSIPSSQGIAATDALANCAGAIASTVLEGGDSEATEGELGDPQRTERLLGACAEWVDERSAFHRSSWWDRGLLFSLAIGFLGIALGALLTLLAPPSGPGTDR